MPPQMLIAAALLIVAAKGQFVNVSCVLKFDQWIIIVIVSASGAIISKCALGMCGEKRKNTLLFTTGRCEFLRLAMRYGVVVFLKEDVEECGELEMRYMGSYLAGIITAQAFGFLITVQPFVVT